VRKVGEQAPGFELEDQNGNTVTLDSLLEKGELILYFYPVDFSPVCTAQACAFRDRFDGIQASGRQIVGVSPQSAATHRRFAEQFGVPFPMLADPGKRVIRAYGVDGPLGFGVRRATFLIGADGVIRSRVVSDLLLGSHTELIDRTLKAASAG
jgi:peroxiredoxin Q/BCP